MTSSQECACIVVRIAFPPLLPGNIGILGRDWVA